MLFQQLLESDVPEDPYLSKELVRYFPQPLQEKYAKVMEGHRLKREIIATAVTNSMVNRMGATFTLRMTALDETALPPVPPVKKSSSSGCSVGSADAPFDPMLPGMLALALAGLTMRRKRAH